MTILEVATRLGVTPATIEHWEEGGAVFPRFEKSPNGGRRRVYDPWHVLKLQAVQELRDQGVSVVDAIRGADDLVVSWWRAVAR